MPHRWERIPNHKQRCQELRSETRDSPRLDQGRESGSQMTNTPSALPDDEAGEIVRRLQDEAIIWSGMPVVGTAASRLPAMVKLLVEAASFIERLTRSIAMKNELIDASNEAARLPPQKGST